MKFEVGVKTEPGLSAGDMEAKVCASPMSPALRAGFKFSKAAFISPQDAFMEQS